jgi:hypothetical protein
MIKRLEDPFWLTPESHKWEHSSTRVSVSSSDDGLNPFLRVSFGELADSYSIGK